MRCFVFFFVAVFLLCVQARVSAHVSCPHVPIVMCRRGSELITTVSLHDDSDSRALQLLSVKTADDRTEWKLLRVEPALKVLVWQLQREPRLTVSNATAFVPLPSAVVSFTRGTSSAMEVVVPVMACNPIVTLAMPLVTWPVALRYVLPAIFAVIISVVASRRLRAHWRAVAEALEAAEEKRRVAAAAQSASVAAAAAAAGGVRVFSGKDKPIKRFGGKGKQVVAKNDF